MDSTMSPRYQDQHHHKAPLLIPPPQTTTNSNNNNNNGLLLSPKPITRSEPANPYPTTFVQADTSSFKQVVQMLTGSSETAKQASSNKPVSPAHHHSTIPPIKPNTKNKQQQSGFKLYERRNSLKNLNINPLMPVFSSNGSGFSPRKPEILSPSILDFPALVLSPVTPLIPDPFDRSGAPTPPGFNGGNRSPCLDAEAEEKAIKEKGFFLHPSPASTPRDSEPRLLPLFPTTSPRAASSASGSSSSSSSAAAS